MDRLVVRLDPMGRAAASPRVAIVRAGALEDVTDELLLRLAAG